MRFMSTDPCPSIYCIYTYIRIRKFQIGRIPAPNPNEKRDTCQYQLEAKDKLVILKFEHVHFVKKGKNEKTSIGAKDK